VISFLAATFAKLREGRTVGAKVGPAVWVEYSFECKDAGGICEGGAKLRSVPVRELDLDMAIFSRFTPRSRSRRSATSFSRELTSTGRAAPNGFPLELFRGDGPIFGEDSGLGEVEALPDLGSNSNFLRANCGVGGVELLGDTLLRAEFFLCPSSTSPITFIDCRLFRRTHVTLCSVRGKFAW